MHKPYLSPSQQEHNVGIGKYGRESDRCRLICDMAAELLKGVPDLKVRVAPDYTALDEPADYLAAVRDSNAWGADVHVAVHSNAAGKGADGTDTFYFANSARGKRLASCLQRRVAPVSPGSDGGIHAQLGWAELDKTAAVACLIELGFHTDPADAVSIITQPGLYAAALADGITDYLGVQRSAKQPVPAAYKRAKDAFTRLPAELRAKFLKYAPKWRAT